MAADLMRGRAQKSGSGGARGIVEGIGLTRRPAGKDWSSPGSPRPSIAAPGLGVSSCACSVYYRQGRVP